MPLSAIYRQLDDHLGTDETPYNAGAALERLMGWMEEREQVDRTAHLEDGQ